MEIFHLENNIYTPICSICKENCFLKINKTDLKLDTICSNNHIRNINPDQVECLKSISLNYNYCSNCFSILNEKHNNFICINCNKIFCPECINKHKIIDHHSNFKLYFNIYFLCPSHNQKNIYFCLNCKNNFCQGCLNIHKGHIYKSLLDIIPNNKERETKQIQIKENTKKIKEMIDFLKENKKNINYRINKLEQYLTFLNSINMTFLEKFNYSYYNYYNYENFNYLYNYLNKEINIKKDDILKYIVYGKGLNIFEKNDLIKDIIPLPKHQEQEKEKDEVNNFPIINNLEHLEYFKDNIFFIFLENNNSYTKTIILYEYKDYSFKELCKYSFENSYKIGKVKVSKYNNYIYLLCSLFKKIKILEYNPEEKTIFKSEKEIRSKKQYGERFTSIIDNKNGNIITIDSNKLTIWKKNNKNIRYDKIIFYEVTYNELFNLNDSLFLCQDNHKTIFFYETRHYSLVKRLSFLDDFEFLGTIQDKIFSLVTIKSKYIFLIDLNYLDICQIINVYHININNLFLLNDSLLNIKNNGNKIIINKKKFDFKFGYFVSDKTFEKEIKYFSFSKILKTENNSIVFVNKDQITLIKL